MRNHHYQFVITKVGGNIEVNYTVAEWIHEKKKHHWTQEFSYPTYLNLRPWDQISETDELKIVYPDEPTMYYDANNPEAGAFVVGFKMTGPQGQNWTPAMDKSDTEYDLKVYQNGEEISFSQCIASPDWYQIKLIPKSPKNVDTNVQFGITTTLSWEYRILYLLINGQDENTVRWPNSGNDARLIQVKQIKAPSSNNGNNENEDNT